ARSRTGSRTAAFSGVDGCAKSHCRPGEGRDPYAGKLMREAVLVAFLRRMSQQPTFVVMGPGSRPGRRIVVDALARDKRSRHTPRKRGIQYAAAFRLYH